MESTEPSPPTNPQTPEQPPSPYYGPSPPYLHFQAPQPPSKGTPTWAIGLVVAGVIEVAILSTTQQPPTPPPPEPERWVAVASFSGSTDKTTDSFLITGSKFRVLWTATAENEFGLFILDVYEVGHTL